MKIRKAVITAAGRNQRALPTQALVDRDGNNKTALQIVIEEAAAAGCEEVCVVVCPGDEAAYATAAGKEAGRLSFVAQQEPRGYGHALWCAHAFTGADAFLHLISDHLYLSNTNIRCAQQLVQIAEREDCNVSAVQATRESKLPYYGVIGGQLVPQKERLFQVECVMEKPTPTQAEQTLVVPGLRAGNYLSLFGLHVLTPAVMNLLDEMVQGGGSGIQLSSALNSLSGRERYLAMELDGRRFDIGVKYGLLMAQMALCLDGAERDEVLTQLVELLADPSRTVSR